MKSVRNRKLSRNAGLTLTATAGLAVLLALVAVASAGGFREPRSGSDRAKGSSAGDPDGVPEMEPVFGSATPPAETITPEAGKALLAEFQRAQSGELKALDHRNKLELKELKASQTARQKEWEKHEKEARHKYFSEHSRGPDRRAYIKDFMDRRRAFLQSLVDENKQRAHEQDVRAAALRTEQQERLKEFQEALGRKQRPSAKLWPSSS